MTLGDALGDAEAGEVMVVVEAEDALVYVAAVELEALIVSSGPACRLAGLVDVSEVCDIASEVLGCTVAVCVVAWLQLVVDCRTADWECMHSSAVSLAPVEESVAGVWIDLSSCDEGPTSLTTVSTGLEVVESKRGAEMHHLASEERQKESSDECAGDRAGYGGCAPLPMAQAESGSRLVVSLWARPPPLHRLLLCLESLGVLCVRARRHSIGTDRSCR